MNSGAASSSVSPWAGARRVCDRRCASPHSRFAPSSCGASSWRVAAAAEALADRVRPLDALHERRGAVPVGAAVRPARRRPGLPGSLPEQLERCERRRCPASTGRLKPAIAGDDVVVRRLVLRAAARPTPRAPRGARDRRWAGRRRSRMNAPATRSTAAGGGSSAMKWRASLVAMRCAVEGWRARSRSTATPCPKPAVGIARAEHHLRARLVQLGAEHELPGLRRRRSARRRPPIDQPVMHLGEGGDVGLRVAAADPERVQLEDLARQILVDADLALRLAPLDALARPASAGRRDGGCPGTAASPDASRPRAAGRGSCRARAGGWPRARSCRRDRRAAACPPRPRSDCSRTASGARAKGARCSTACCSRAVASLT